MKTVEPALRSTQAGLIRGRENPAWPLSGALRPDYGSVRAI
jgi:hypothetical protein